MSQVTTSDRGPVRIITLTNPPRGYMNATNAAELLGALQDALAAPEIRVIVFTGGLPGVFIRHYDVGEIKAVEGALRAGAIQPGGDRAASPVYALIDLMLACEKSTIAAINGICMGGGCEFALCCDLRIAETGDYTIGLPETRLGIIPGVGGLQLLARTVGLSRAREMVMRGRVVGPNEALRIGLVDEVVSVTLDRALEIAAELAANPPHAVAATKRLARRVAAGETLEQGLLT
ncbi:MAG: enoyl-CoA hydratase/isomerase family protein, partial [Novosphingobium sp.]